MAEYQMLGLFEDVAKAGDAIDALRKIGVSDRKITVMSAAPLAPKMLGRKHANHRLLPLAGIGALGGFGLGFFLTYIMPQLYPIVVAGRDIVNVPPSFIILFELTMLGVMVATFVGFLLENGFPKFGPKLYDKRIAEGYIGVQAQVNDEVLFERTRKVYADHGAQHLQEMEVKRTRDPRLMILIVLLILAGGFATFTLLIFYDIITLPWWPDQMKETLAVAPLQGPRYGAPEGSIPVQGPSLIGNEPATAPLPAAEDSIQRGEVLFALHCAHCHALEEAAAPTVVGDKFVVPPPAMTSDRVAGKTPEQVFVTITNGWGLMLPLAENLYPEERWDVANYVYSLSH